MLRFKWCTVLLLALSASAYGDDPFIFTWDSIQSAQPWSSDSETYVDIPDSGTTITIPAGTAIINWSLSLTRFEGQALIVTEVRPKIGGDAPAHGPIVTLNGNDDEAVGGSWAVVTTGGSLSIRLQGRIVEGVGAEFGQNKDNFMSWNIAVFSDSSPVESTSFTYQGELVDDGVAVDDDCDFDFKLYDAVTSGTQIGSTQSPTVTVTDGRFSTVLDFGSGRFPGDDRWLEVSACCPTSCTPSAFSPRQELTPTPYAITAGAE